MTTRYCILCNEPFEPAKSNQKFCCRNHQQKYNRHKRPHKVRARVKNSDRTCQGCGRSIYGTRWHKYCGLSACRELFRLEKLRERRKEDVPRHERKPKYKCTRCGEWIKNGNRLHCPHCVEVMSNCYAPEAEGFANWWI